MDCWSAENATNAFLRTLKMGERGNAPDVTEFISAMAAGNNSQLMVMACSSGHPGSALLGLVAAAHQTGGHVVCILRTQEQVHAIKETLLLGDHYANHVEFVVGGGDHDVKTLLASNYEGADFVLIDCKLEDFQQVFQVAQQGVSPKGAFIVGYNALHEGPRLSTFDHKGYFLPIGEGLLVSKIRVSEGKKIIGGGRRSHWVFEVDECTGEEHVYRVSTSPNTN